MSDAPPTMRIRALRDLDVDGVRIPEGAAAAIRRELVAALVACGAADDEVEQPAPPAPAQTDTMPGHLGGATAAPAAPPAAPAAAVREGAEAITKAEAGPVSAEGQAATPGEAEAAPGAKEEAGEAAGASDHDAAVGGTEAQPAAPPAAAVSVGEAPAAEAPPAGRSRRRG